MLIDYAAVYKVLLIGDSAVGKTCISNRFTRNEFTHRTIHTIGVDFAVQTLEIEGKMVKAQIWDTAGQEKYRAITNAYYRGAAGALLVFDLTARDSFEGLARWLKELGEHASSNISVVVIGNKLDLVEQRAVEVEEAQRFCERHGCSYLETSAAENTNVTEAFTLLLQEIYNKSNTAKALQANGENGGSSKDIQVDASGTSINLDLFLAGGPKRRLRPACCSGK